MTFIIFDLENVMTKKSRSIMATTAIVTVLTLMFKVLGFVKQAVVA